MGLDQMRFIDLFAGLGGFHMALRKLGHECVFACEIDETLRDLYCRNFGFRPAGDIRDIDLSDIPDHEILCAGFPCQPFSKARNRNFGSVSELAELYMEIIRVVEHKHPLYLIMENVPDLIKHNDGKTWNDIRNRLVSAGYDVPEPYTVSPDNFGIPQVRKRVYIVGSKIPLEGIKWPEPCGGDPKIREILDTNPPEAKAISNSVERCLSIWQALLDNVPKHERIPLPLWSMEFGATYPYVESTPFSLPTVTLRERYLGSHGQHLHQAKTRQEVLGLLPSHARTKQRTFPKWKVNFIQKNRQFYAKHKDWLDDWMTDIKQFPSSFQKLEWNCNERNPLLENRRIYDYIIQTRPSGVRIKRPSTAPSLVAMASTQVPIIGWEQRYMTLDECKRLQSIENTFDLPEAPTKAYAALGNAVNVEVARLVAESLFAVHDRRGLNRVDCRGSAGNLGHQLDFDLELRVQAK